MALHGTKAPSLVRQLVPAARSSSRAVAIPSRARTFCAGYRTAAIESKPISQALRLRRRPRPLVPSSTPCGCAASYHSYDHPDQAGPFNKEEQALLSAAYAHVPEHGFTQQALVLGARDAGYLDISTNLLPEGVFSLIRYHLATKRLALAARSRELFETPEGAALSTEAKVQRLAWERLVSNREVIGRWQEALAIMAQPSFVPASAKELALLADEILFLSGDASVDPSWYTKRASLSAIYAATELFMTNDRSPGFEDTAAFMRRRFGEAGDVSSVFGAVGQWIGFTASAGLNVLRSKGARI